jgi:biopolymer transport protein ExbD
MITVDKEGAITIKEIPFGRALLVQELKKHYETSKDQAIYLMADEKVTYGYVMEIMDDIKSVGFDKVGMITDPLVKE